MVLDNTQWTEEELEVLAELNTPPKIQRYLDEINYNPAGESRSPRQVIRERRANCLEGALLAAACLRQIGYAPLVVDLRAVNDDDHVIAVYRKRKYWGAIAKSNFTTLRGREPAYKTLRELVMSYFDFYFNISGEKTLREYSIPLNLSRFDRKGWMTTNQEVGYIGDYLNRIRHRGVIDLETIAELSTVSTMLLEAGLRGANSEGLYKPK